MEANLGKEYGWPGNYRELEQCVRNILIRRDYQAVAPARKRKGNGNLFDDAKDGALTASELLSRYCTLVYSQTGSYEETARRLQIDRRTAKAKVDEALLEKIKQGG